MVDVFDEKQMRKIAEDRPTNEKTYLATKEIDFLLNKNRELNPEKFDQTGKKLLEEAYRDSGTAEESDLKNRIRNTHQKLPIQLQRILNDIVLLNETDFIKPSEKYWEKFLDMRVFVNATNQFRPKSGMINVETGGAFDVGYDVGLAFRMLLGAPHENAKSGRFLLGFFYGQTTVSTTNEEFDDSSNEDEIVREILEEYDLEKSDLLLSYIQAYLGESSEKDVTEDSVREVVETLLDTGLEEILSLKKTMDLELDELEKASARGVRAKPILMKVRDEVSTTSSNIAEDLYHDDKVSQVSETLNKLAKEGKNRSEGIAALYHGAPIVRWDQSNGIWHLTAYGKILLKYMDSDNIDWLYNHVNRENIPTNALDIHAKEHEWLDTVFSKHSFD